MPVDTRRNKRKLRREFRQKGYRAVYLEVSGYPPASVSLPMNGYASKNELQIVVSAGRSL